MRKACIMCGITSDEVSERGITCYGCGRWICEKCWTGYADRCLCGLLLEKVCKNCEFMAGAKIGCGSSNVIYVCEKDKTNWKEVHPLYKGCEKWKGKLYI